MLEFEDLDWDSGFFGFPIAKMSCDLPNVTEEAIRSRMICDGYRLVYLRSNEKVKQLAASFIVSQLELRCSVPVVDFEQFSINDADRVQIIQVTTAPCEEIVRLANEASVESRFRIDRRFSKEQCDRLYRIWIERSCNGEIADYSAVATEQDRSIGVVTLATRWPTAKIGIIAVDPAKRGLGIGRQLIQAALAQAAMRDCAEVAVVTQVQNTAATGLYEKCGFSRYAETHWYHFWNEEL